MPKILDYIDKVPVAVKASTALFIANLISKGISYLTTPIYTRVLTTEEFGTVSIFQTWYQVFGIIAMFCLSQGIFNNGMVNYPDERDEYSCSMLQLSNLFTAFFTVLIIIIFPYVSHYIKLDFKYIILMIVLFIFQPAYNFWFTRQRYELKWKSILWSSLLCTVLSPAIAVIAIFAFPNRRLEARIFGAEIPLILIYVIFYLYISKKTKFKIYAKYWKEAVYFNLPLIIHYLSMYLLSSSDRIMIVNLVGKSATAYYSISYSVASIALIIWNAVNSSLIPYTYEKCKNNEREDINSVTMPILAILFFASILVILMAPEVVSFIATDEYSDAIMAIPPIVGGVYFQAMYSIFANIVYYYKKPIFVTIGSVVSVCFNLILNYIFIRKYGYIAAGYTTLFCYIMQASIDYVGMRLVVGENIYDVGVIITLSIFVIMISILSQYIYNYPLYRYIIIATLIAFGLYNRRTLLNMIRIR